MTWKDWYYLGMVDGIIYLASFAGLFWMIRTYYLLWKSCKDAAKAGKS